MLSRFKLLLLLAATVCAQGAVAGDFSVSPVRLEFAGISRSQLLSITNAGDKPSRFLARATSWTMTENGGVELKEDDTLLVFPASFTIAGKATQNIRVGTDQRAGDTERTWRVVLEELPDADTAGSQGATINVLSIISVPVFMPPVVPRKALAVSSQGFTGNAAKVGVVNSGNLHQMMAGVSVTAMRGEEVIQQAQQEGWYILPGRNRAYTINGAANWCAPGVTRFELRVADRDGQSLARQTIDAREACR